MPTQRTAKTTNVTRATNASKATKSTRAAKATKAARKTNATRASKATRATNAAGARKTATASNRAQANKSRRAEDRLELFKAEALDTISTAIMMVDRDLVIYYLNDAAYLLMKESADAFAEAWPGFDPDALLGTCVDGFHEDPSHQRRILDDPNNLPYQADIEVGGLSFGLTVTAQITESGEYVGCALEWEDLTRLLDADSKLEALDRAQSLVEFDVEGHVVSCNENFERTLGYELSEIRGLHHRHFVDEATSKSAEYDDFWRTLRNGEPVEGEFKRISKSGEEVWLRATYSPVLDRGGNPVSFFKVGTDVTETKRRHWDLEARMAAVNRGQATVDFDLSGNVLSCNQNFCDVMGYTATEVEGRHHRMFLGPDFIVDDDYRRFWERLRSGEAIEGEFEREAKDGRKKWLRASYNPVLDQDGKPVRFFKLATDITAERTLRGQIEQIVGRVSEVMEAVAEGDLSQAIEGDYDERLGDLQTATNASIENLAALVTQIRSAARSITAASSLVAEANQGLSRRTESQASSLEETAASMEEMSITVQQNAQNSRQASELAIEARSEAEGGGRVVGEAVGAMAAISESSKKIADIIGVIDEIAFQTNLLALNAAVEAARAGDQGRGFAVVAAEVRNLAQRSAEAAKEIKTLIQDSLEKVDDGSKLVNRSGEQLAGIVRSVSEVSGIIGEIAAASEQQSTGISQVNQAVVHLEQGTQQNTAMVEEATVAADSMAREAEMLLGFTDQFRLADDAEMIGQRSAMRTAKPDKAAKPGKAAQPGRAQPQSSPGADTGGHDAVWQEFST